MNSIRNLDGRVNRFRASQRAANPLAVSAARIALRISNLLKAFDALAIPFHQRQGGNADRSQPPIPKEILMRISGFGNSRNRSDFGGSSGTGPDIRRGISGLPACLRPDHLLRVQLYVAASMQRVGLGPLGAMRRQSLLGKCVSGSAHTQARRLLSAVLTERRCYSISTTLPSTSETRRSIRPARSILWVAISIATRVAFTSCMSALNT